VKGFAAIFALVSIAQAQVHRAGYVPDSDDIRAILEQRLAGEHSGAGIVAGVIDASGQRVVSYPDILNGDTIFQIGSLTKVFTALLLTDAVQRGEVSLADPVSKYAPAAKNLPPFITLEAVATHTSGLPRMPSNFGSDPYTPKMLFDFLATYQPPVDMQWKYSNLGYGLLAQAIAPDFEPALHVRITGPLDMDSTHIALAPREQQRLAPGPPSDFGALAAAAGLHSTVNDLLKLLSAALGYTKSPLGPALSAMLDVRRDTTEPGLTNALGWQISMPDGLEIIWKDGITPAYSSFFGYNRKAHVGVVVLSNTSSKRGVSDIGMYILDGASQLFRRVR
jgi:serine-type D-Ala-D-Ala carboxypeptidase/endopeptidase